MTSRKFYLWIPRLSLSLGVTAISIKQRYPGHARHAGWAAAGRGISTREYACREGYKDIKRIVDEAYEMLPSGPWRVKVRSDTAGYQQKVLDHWDGRKWQFGVSADMSVQLRPTIEALLHAGQTLLRLAGSAWQPLIDIALRRSLTPAPS